MAMRSLVYPNAVADHALGQARQPLPTTTKTIPFDYVFQFTLKGERDNRVQDVVEISMEGVFVALSMGYSLVLDEQRRPRTFQPVNHQRTIPQNPVLVPFFPESDDDAAVVGELDGFLVAGMPESEIAILTLSEASQIIIIDTSRTRPDGTVTVNRQIDSGTYAPRLG